jgi:hypothetical protein
MGSLDAASLGHAPLRGVSRIARPPRLLVSLQLSLSPVMVLAIGIDDPLAMPMDSLQRRRSSKKHRVVLLGRPVLAVRHHIKRVHLQRATRVLPLAGPTKLAVFPPLLRHASRQIGSALAQTSAG